MVWTGPLISHVRTLAIVSDLEEASPVRSARELHCLQKRTRTVKISRFKSDHVTCEPASSMCRPIDRHKAEGQIPFILAGSCIAPIEYDGWSTLSTKPSIVENELVHGMASPQLRYLTRAQAVSLPSAQGKGT